MKAALCPEWVTLGRDLRKLRTLKSLIIVLSQSVSPMWTIPEAFRHAIEPALELHSAVKLQYVSDLK